MDFIKTWAFRIIITLAVLGALGWIKANPAESKGVIDWVKGMVSGGINGIITLVKDIFA